MHPDVDRVREISDAYTRRTSELTDRLEQLEARADRPRGSSSPYSPREREHTKTFCDYIRHSKNPVYQSRLAECEISLAEADGRKDVTIGSNAGGGYALPKEISGAIERRLRDLSPLRQLADVQQTGSNDFNMLVSMGDATSGWSSETGTRSATASPTLRNIKPTMGELYALPTCSEWALDDIFFDVVGWLTQDIADEFSNKEGIAFISGNGSSQPTGLLNSTPTLSADYASPMRAAAVLQYIALVNAPSPLRVNIDSLIQLVATVNPRYTADGAACAFVMHPLTLASLQQAKATSSGVYLWGDAMNGVPPRLLGYPVYTTSAWSTNVAGNFVAAFGNWKRGYLIADRVGMRITPNPYSTPGLVSFYVRKRVGGIIKNNDAVKVLRNA